MLIDAYSHIMPPAVFDEIREVNPSETIESHNQVHFQDIQNRLQDLDDFGIDKQVLTLASADSWLGIASDDALPIVELANNEIRRMADDNPERFIPVATLPFVHGPFMDEFHRCIDDLGMQGVQIFSNIQGKQVDSRDYRPLFEAANDKGVPVWIHPQLSEYDVTGGSIFYGRLFGWLFDTTIALCRLVFSGIMEENPNLNVITHHTGGMIPYFHQRIEDLYEIREFLNYDQYELTDTVRENFQSFFADTVVSGSADALYCGYQFYGEDQMVFATDYPYGQDGGRHFLRQEREALERVDIPESGREKIKHENIASLVDIGA